MKSLISLSALRSSPLNYLQLLPNYHLPLSFGPDRVAYSMLKHFSCFGVNVLLHICNLSALLFLHLAVFIYYTFSQNEMSLDSRASIGPISLTSCVSNCLSPSFYSVYLFFSCLLIDVCRPTMPTKVLC